MPEREHGRFERRTRRKWRFGGERRPRISLSSQWTDIAHSDHCRGTTEGDPADSPTAKSVSNILEKAMKEKEEAKSKAKKRQ